MQGLQLRGVAAGAVCGLPRRHVSPWPTQQAVQCSRAGRLACRAEGTPDGSAAVEQEKPKRRGRRKSKASSEEGSPATTPASSPDPAAIQAEGSLVQQEQEDAAFEEEYRLQEEEVELTIDDLVQMQYEMPTEEQLAQEDQELLQELQEEATPVAAPVAAAVGPAVEVLGQEQAVRQGSGTLSRKAAVLLEIITAAAGPDLDAKIAQFSDDIDEEMLQLLHTRVEAVAKVDDRAAEQLRELESILWVVYQRTTSSPAMRLLDEVLDLLGDDVLDEQGYTGQRLKAQARMREAFFGGAQQGMDIFAAAAALAESGPLAASELVSEQVEPSQFLAETTVVMQEAKESQTQLAADIQRAEREIQYAKKTQPQLLTSSHGRAHLAQLDKARRMHASRAVALSQLQDVLSMARQVASQRITGQDDEFE